MCRRERERPEERKTGREEGEQGKQSWLSADKALLKQEKVEPGGRCDQAAGASRQPLEREPSKSQKPIK